MEASDCCNLVGEPAHPYSFYVSVNSLKYVGLGWDAIQSILIVLSLDQLRSRRFN